MEEQFTKLESTFSAFTEQMTTAIYDIYKKLYDTYTECYKALFICNALVNSLVEKEQKEIGVILQQEEDIDSITSLLLFNELCGRYNKKIEHIMQISYTGKATIITKGSKEKLKDIQFFALDCEYRDSNLSVINIHNHLNDEKFSNTNIAPYAYIYKDKLQTNPYAYTSKEFINKNYGGRGVRRGLSTSMILMDNKTSEKYYSWILAADTCSYAIVVDSYMKDNGFQYAEKMQNEIKKLGLNTAIYSNHLSYSRNLKKSIELTREKENGGFIFEQFRELTEEQKQIYAEYKAITKQDFVHYESINNASFSIDFKQSMSEILEEISARENANIELIAFALSDYSNMVFAKYTYRTL